MCISAQFWTFLATIVALAVCTAVGLDTAFAKPRPQMAPLTMAGSIAACDKVKRSSKNAFNCVVTFVQGHPTLTVDFANERSMRACLGTFSKQVTDPFCKAANHEATEAFFVVTLKNPRMGSVSWCETGESNGWVSLESLEQS